MLIKNSGASQVGFTIAGVSYVFAPQASVSVPDAQLAQVLVAMASFPHLELVFMGTTLNCSFVMDHTNGNGVGVRNLKGNGIASVHSHSSVPVSGNNCPAGIIQVNLSQAWAQYFGGFAGAVSPLSGIPVAPSAFTLGQVLVITTVGSTNWQACGLAAGVVAAPGVAFIASGAGSGSGSAQAPAPSGMNSVEVIGDANQTVAATGGGYILLACLGLPSSGQVPLVTAPADGAVIGATFFVG